MFFTTLEKFQKIPGSGVGLPQLNKNCRINRKNSFLSLEFTFVKGSAEVKAGCSSRNSSSVTPRT